MNRKRLPAEGTHGLMKEGHVPVLVVIKKGPNLLEESFGPGDMILPDTDGSAAARTQNEKNRDAFLRKESIRQGME